MSTKTIIALEGSWPEWVGNLGMKFVYIRIRYGQCRIGVGADHNQARGAAEIFKEDAQNLSGVVGMEEAVNMLRAAGYTVESIVVPSHIEPVPDNPPKHWSFW